MTRAVFAALLLGTTLLLPGGKALAQASPALTCSPRQTGASTDASPSAVLVDCVFGGSGAQGPWQTISALVFGPPTNETGTVACSSGFSVPCSVGSAGAT